MKKLLVLLISSVILFGSTYALTTIAKVYPHNGTFRCMWRGISTGDYAEEVAISAALALAPEYMNNPSAIFLSGSTPASINARGKALWAPKCVLFIAD